MFSYREAPFGARFFLVHFQGLSRLRRVAAVRAPWDSPAALRRCPALRLAVSATGGARLRAPSARISGPMEFGPPGSKTNEKDHPFGWSFSFGALPGTRTLGPLIKSQLLYHLLRPHLAQGSYSAVFA